MTEKSYLEGFYRGKDSIYSMVYSSFLSSHSDISFPYRVKVQIEVSNYKQKHSVKYFV